MRKVFDGFDVTYKVMSYVAGKRFCIHEWVRDTPEFRFGHGVTRKCVRVMTNASRDVVILKYSAKQSDYDVVRSSDIGALLKVLYTKVGYGRDVIMDAFIAEGNSAAVTYADVRTYYDDILKRYKLETTAATGHGCRFVKLQHVKRESTNASIFDFGWRVLFKVYPTGERVFIDKKNVKALDVLMEQYIPVF